MIVGLIVTYFVIGAILAAIWQFTPKDATGSNLNRLGFGTLLLFFWLPIGVWTVINRTAV